MVDGLFQAINAHLKGLLPLNEGIGQVWNGIKDAQWLDLLNTKETKRLKRKFKRFLKANNVK